MSDLTIRRVRPLELDRVRELHRVALGEAGTDPDQLPDTSDLEDPIEHYVEAGGEFLVGTHDEEVVAIGGLRPIAETTAEIKRMRVDPRHQGRGFGRSILEGLESAARERDFERVVLDTARRQGSAGFYRAQGYREVDRRTWREFELIEFEKRLDRPDDATRR